MTVLDTWKSLSGPPRLKEGELHIWRVNLSETDERPDLLSHEEQARAAQFKAEAVRRHFVVMRAALREILGRYLEEVPVIEIGEYGKPGLAGGHVHFNLSHSGDIGLIAVTRAGDVGVDIERVNPARSANAIAARFFSAKELEVLQRHENGQRTRAFFRCWTRKEAVIKALGEGLACPLPSFDVSLDEHRAALLDFRRDGIEPAQWNMTHIAAGDAYEAAAAVIGSCTRVAGYQFRHG